MAKLALLFILLFSSLASFSVVTPVKLTSKELKVLKRQGDYFCQTVISPMSKGPNHYKACLEAVLSIINQDVKGENDLIIKICENSGKFPFADTVKDPGLECFKRAWQERSAQLSECLHSRDR